MQTRNREWPIAMVGNGAPLLVAIQFLRHVFDWWFSNSLLTHRVPQTLICLLLKRL